jgi:hypothetical protein
VDESAVPARALFDSLGDWGALEQLVADAEAEGQYLECKSPRDPQLGQDLRSKTSQALSAFSNTGGGVLIFGMATDNHAHSGLDVLSQTEPIGQVARFRQRLQAALPRLTTPSANAVQIRVVKQAVKDTKGVVVLHVPAATGDPIQGDDSRFYMRAGDENLVMPYELIKPLVSPATATPPMSAATAWIGSGRRPVTTTFAPRVAGGRPDRAATTERPDHRRHRPPPAARRSGPRAQRQRERRGLPDVRQSV